MMKKLLIVMFSTTLFLAGCGDKDETAGEKLDNAIEATEEAAADSADAVGDAYDATKEAVGDAADAVSDAVDDETDDTKTQ
jgi:protein involved in sex pheromone biosynthesis